MNLAAVLLVGEHAWLDTAEAVCRKVGWPTDRVRSGARALLRLLHDEHAGLIAELDASGIGGRDLALAARLSPGTACLPVFLLAGEGREDAAREAAEECGADGWLTGRVEAPRALGQLAALQGEDRPVPTPAWPPRAPEPAGALRQRIGRWEVEEMLGRGGYATVYGARDGDQRVALKLLHPEVLREPTDLVRFLREVAALHLVRVPEVVRLLDWGWAGDGLPYLALERLEGSSLGDRCEREGTISPALAARVLGDVARALEATSRLGLVHRDVSPWNVWLRPEGGATLIDFGLAKGRGTGHVTQGEQLLGTAPYLAPELLRSGSATLATDLYALGATLHWSLGGKHLHDESSMRTLLRLVSEGKPPTALVHQLRPDLPGPLASAVERLCDADPEVRLRAFAGLLGRSQAA